MGLDEQKCVREERSNENIRMEVEEPRRKVRREEGISGVGTQHESVRLHSGRETKESVFVLEELENEMCELLEL